ncbi:MAG: DUF5060 domain-containing protein [Planctomycetota bacterium]
MGSVGKTIGLLGAVGVLGLGAIALAAQLAQAQPLVHTPMGGNGMGGALPKPSFQTPEPTGERRVGRAITLDFTGPAASETDLSPSPFLDYRLRVIFTGPSGQVFDVPGYFAGDGATGTTPGSAVAPAGDVWRTRFAPDEAGTWTWSASLRQGDGVAIDLDPEAGAPWPGFEAANGGSAFDGAGARRSALGAGGMGSVADGGRVGGAGQSTVRGAFDVAAVDPSDDGFFKFGRLDYNGTHYLTFTHGPAFIKGGVDSPENWLGYYGFDNTFSANDRGPDTPDRLHRFAPHIQDWNPGDPDWDSPDTPETNDGRGIIGALNYLSGTGVNSIYFLPMNIGGDAQDTWPYESVDIDGAGNANNNNLTFDLSKLNQWEIVFEHAQRKGLLLHVVLNEAETANKLELDDATLGTERRVFYRELVARFAHHNALVWNISEEYNLNLNLGAQAVRDFAGYIKAVDPYDRPVTVHNAGNPFNPNSGPWAPFIGDDAFDLTSLQRARQLDGWGEVVRDYREASAQAGKPIPVMIDEPGSPTRDAGGDLNEFRKRVIYDILFSGGGGEWFINDRDQSLEDFREFDQLWRETGIALEFMHEHLPFTEMAPLDEVMFFDDDLFGGAEVLAKPGAVYACYFPDAGGLGGSDTAGILDLNGQPGTYEIRWFNPRTGAFVGEPTSVEGDGAAALGEPPIDETNDWIALVTLVDLQDCDGDGVPECRCPADLAGDNASTEPDGVVNMSDFQTFLQFWTLEDLRADFTGPNACDFSMRDATVDLSDFACYLSLWAMGCP